MKTVLLSLSIILTPNPYIQPKVTKKGSVYTVTNHLDYKAEVWVTCGDDYLPEHFTMKAGQKIDFTVVPDSKVCYVYDFWVVGLK